MPKAVSRVPPLPKSRVRPAPTVPTNAVEEGSLTILALPTGGDFGKLPVRQPTESPEMYERFLHWLLPPDGMKRSITRAARELDLHTATLQEQAERYGWRERALQYDRQQLAIASVEQGQLAREHAVAALQMVRSLRDRLAAIVADAEDADAGEFVSLALDASKVLDRLVRNERLILGLSTSHESIAVSDATSKRKGLQDLRHLTDEQVELYSALPLLELIANKERPLPEHRNDLAFLGHLEALLRWLPQMPHGPTDPEHRRRWAEVYGDPPCP